MTSHFVSESHSESSVFFRIGLLIVVFLVVATPLLAQSFTAVGGSVTDPTGAAVPGASIELQNTDTHVKRTVVSDQAGRYTFPQISPGNYIITAKGAGFAEVVTEKFALQVNTPVVLNVELKILKTVNEKIVVTADSTQVSLTDASLGNTIGTTAIMQLPLENRNVVGLLSLQPGVTYIGSSNNSNSPDDSRNGSVNGGKSDQGNVVLDGIDVNDYISRSAFTSVLGVTLDSVAEFRVTTTNANADQGHSSGAQVALVTKSGTNALHGSMYEYTRNTITTANTFFNNAQGIPRPKLIRNVFGASLGGPVIKNHLFYFLTYEGHRDASESSTERHVPSADLRLGIVHYLNTAGTTGTLTAAQMTALDPAGLGSSQAVLGYLQSFPEPNDPFFGDQNFQGFRFNAHTPAHDNTYVARIDYAVDSAGKHTLFWRGSLLDSSALGAPQFPGQGASGYGTNAIGYAIGYNAVLTPTLIGTFRYGLTRAGNNSSNSGAPAVVSFRNLDDPINDQRGLSQVVPLNQTTQDFTWVHGPHSIQFGGDERWVRLQSKDSTNAYFSGDVDATWLQSGLNGNVPDLDQSTAAAFNDAAAAVLGVVSKVYSNYNYNVSGQVLPTGTPVRRNFVSDEFAMYIQDSWKVNPSLTISAGLRYSLTPPVHDANYQQVTLLPDLATWFNERNKLASQGISQVQAGQIQYVASNGPGGRPLFPFHKKNFAPRVAIAYSPQAASGWLKSLFGNPGSTSIRAGGGMFYDAYGYGIMQQFNANEPGFATSLTNPPSILTFADAPRFTGLYNIPQQLVQPAPTGGFPIVAPNDFSITQAIDDAIVPPYTINIDFSVSRQLPGGFTLTGAYVGRLSRHSLVWADLAQPTNFVDPASGMSYFQAANALATYLLQGPLGAPVASVPKIPFWENLWPGAAGNGLTATQAIYSDYLNYPHNYTQGLADVDENCIPSCSRLGPNIMFNSQFSWLAAFRSIGSGNYNAMQWTLRKRLSQGIQFDLNYTLSKSIDLASSAESEPPYGEMTIINSLNPQQSRGVSNYDMRHQFNANWVVELPVGQGKKWLGGIGHPLNAVIGGWQVSGLWRATSGLPYSVDNGRNWPTNWNNQGRATQIGPVPASHTTLNAPPATPEGTPGPNIWSDPSEALAAYAFTLPGQSGQRNGVRGDGYFGVDLGLGKRFVMPYNEHHSLQFRWETFNVGNNVRFCLGPPYGIEQTLSIGGNNASFGKYTALLTDPRVMQFALRYEF